MQRCDTVAEGIGIAMRRNRRALPLVVRFAGNNADFAVTRLKSYGIEFQEADGMGDAVRRAIQQARARR
jgi:succinyl-CoA synthetase beta subunit